LAFGVQREGLAGLEGQSWGILFENGAGFTDDANGNDSGRRGRGARLSGQPKGRHQAESRKANGEPSREIPIDEHHDSQK
jgi:hypothetical protein